jgi:MFS family permease
VSASAPLPSLTRQHPFFLLCAARMASTVGYQMLAVAVGWEIYAITGSAFDLGLVGLIQFVPAVVLTLLVGHTADRYDRRLIVRLAQTVYALATLMLSAALIGGWLSRNILFAAVFMIGCARTFELPTNHSLMPMLVPERLLPRAVAVWTSANQFAIISGPAAGGLLYAVSPKLVTGVCFVFFAIAMTVVSLVKTTRPAAARESPTLASVLAGFNYIRSRRTLLGVITLDLFVVLLGGATALLPIYARDILATGPTGLGLLRSAPAVGAFLTTLVLSRHPIERHVGFKLFAIVSAFGLATIVFSLSTFFPLSLLALMLLGASDSVSVVIRFSLVQLETPDAMRGRVNAINYLFVGSSNTLGEFESGAVAAWLGAVPSVLIGGIGSLLVAGAWMVLFPQLRRVDRFQTIEK